VISWIHLSVQPGPLFHGVAIVAAGAGILRGDKHKVSAIDPRRSRFRHWLSWKLGPNIANGRQLILAKVQDELLPIICQKTGYYATETPSIIHRTCLLLFFGVGSGYPEARSRSQQRRRHRGRWNLLPNHTRLRRYSESRARGVRPRRHSS
jgi:hypothetical protein